MSESELLVDVDGYVATLTINRPEKRNALNPEIHAGLVKHIDRFADEGEVRCLIIKGQGDLAFSAGDDLTRRPGQAEPEIDPDLIDLAIRALAGRAEVPMATLASPFARGEDPADPNIVKVVVDAAGRACGDRHRRDCGHRCLSKHPVGTTP